MADHKLLGPLGRARRHPDDPIPVAIETSHGLLVASPRTGSRRGFAINPLAAARYRDRHGVSRKKSDPGDALVLANILKRHGCVDSLPKENGTLEVGGIVRHHSRKVPAGDDDQRAMVGPLVPVRKKVERQPGEEDAVGAADGDFVVDQAGLNISAAYRRQVADVEGAYRRYRCRGCAGW
jgi:hypothetical protein